MFFTWDYLKFIITNLLNTFFIASVTENFSIILICDNWFKKQLLKSFKYQKTAWRLEILMAIFSIYVLW